MLKELMQWMVENTQVEEFEVGGRQYSSREIKPIRGPTASTIKFNSLSGLAEFATMNCDKDHAFVHVMHHGAVSVLGKEVDEWEQRDMFAGASLDQHPEVFPFGKFLAPDDFIVQVAALFVASSTRNEIIKLAGNISSEASIEVEDDGISQRVGQKAGVVLKSRATLPPNIELTPYRTFREAIQPTSTFIVRARKNDRSEMPELALFEADGGAWKLEAIKNVATFLKMQLPGWTVIA